MTVAAQQQPAEPIVVRNPATGEILGQVPDQDPEQVRAAVKRARAAQPAWAALSVSERARRVRALQARIVSHTDEIADLLSRECGKTRQEALMMEVVGTCDLAGYFCKRAPAILAPERIPLHLMLHRRSDLHFLPRGVIGIISPWNFPFAIPMGETIMALLAGNAVVLKPSEVTPLIALLSKQQYDASGLPPDLFQVVTGRGGAGAALIDAGIDMCIFTGSTATGRKVAAACGERLIPCTLELGGKAPALVCADADVERTANALIWGAFANAGQVCVSVERAYVHQAVYDELLEKLVERTRKLRQGAPTGADMPDCGSMTWERQIEIVEQRVKSALAAGARALLGGRRRPGAGLFYEPTVLVDCKQDMEVMRKEIFGPVLPIMKVRDEEEGIRLANDSELGLMAYVFTGDRKKGVRLAERLEAGTVMVNDVLSTYAAPETPWGGIKQSGIGRTHSAQGLRDLCITRHINVDRIRPPRRDPFWYPYSDKAYQRMLKLTKFLFGGGRR
ncbi:MAG TPA: aldehyde dehydrogenase family protein [Polyangia bacterium]|nr:aldehyde dehydrogenase family protein [Polyangia bacterium]